MISILLFPGTNCDNDTLYAYNKIGLTTNIIWHKQDTIPKQTQLVVIPGGFSYGDYLRSGAIAKFSPIINALNKYAQKGKKILGICNGFQILLENKMLPGAMITNKNQLFISKIQKLQIINNNNDFLKSFKKNDYINIPIAHKQGNYYIDEYNLQKMYDNEQVILKYKDNPNGSVDNIAGICNKDKNIFALMPHPERAIDKILGSDDGLLMLKGLIS